MGPSTGEVFCHRHYALTALLMTAWGFLTVHGWPMAQGIPGDYLPLYNRRLY